MCGGRRPPKIEPAPTQTDPAVQEAIERERELARKRRGRRSTVLTGQQGLAESPGKTLLGQ